MHWETLTAELSPERRHRLLDEAGPILLSLTGSRPGDRGRLPALARTALEEAAGRMRMAPPTDIQLDELVRALLSRAGGLGFLEQLMPPVCDRYTDLVLNPSGQLWARARGDMDFTHLADQTPSHQEVWQAIESLLGPLGRSCTEASPSVDARMPRDAASGFAGARLKVLHPRDCTGGRLSLAGAAFLRTQSRRSPATAGLGHASGGGSGTAAGGGGKPHQCPRGRGHRHRKDHAAERLVPWHSPVRPNRQDRGSRGTVAAPPQRGHLGGAPGAAGQFDPGLHRDRRRGRCHAHGPQPHPGGRGPDRGCGPVAVPGVHERPLGPGHVPCQRAHGSPDPARRRHVCRCRRALRSLAHHVCPGDSAGGAHRFRGRPPTRARGLWRADGNEHRPRHPFRTNLAIRPCGPGPESVDGPGRAAQAQGPAQDRGRQGRAAHRTGPQKSARPPKMPRNRPRQGTKEKA